MYLQGDFIEDFIFKDLGVIGGIWHNWSWFWAPILIAIVGHLLNLNHRSQTFFRHPEALIAV